MGRSSCFAALGHDFAFDVPDPALARHLDELFAPFRKQGDPSVVYRLREAGSGSGSWVLRAGDDVLGETHDLAHAVAVLLWDVNRQVVARSADLVLLHAAAASCDGDAVLLPAAMESGKTTLVAALVRAGLSYLTDEVVAIEPGSLQVRAYPKALSVDPGSWDLLADLRPHVDPAVADGVPHQWQVPATSIRPDAIAWTARPRVVVHPRWVPGADTDLERLAPPQALLELAGCTFGVRDRPDRDLDALGRLVEGASCYRLRYGALDEACETVFHLLDRTWDEESACA